MAVAGYNIYLGGIKQNTGLVTDLTYALSGMTAETTYSVTVSAVDGAGNESAQSSALGFSTISASSSSEYMIWEQMTGATYEGNGTITRYGTITSWGNKGYGSKAINGNNAISAKGSTNSKQMLGFTTAASAAFGDAPIVVILNNLSSSIQVFELGVQTLADTVITLTADTRVYVRLTDGIVTIEANGTVYHTSAATFTLPLTPMAFLHSDGTSSIINAEFENTTNITTSPI
jgi:hypothetical protein